MFYLPFPFQILDHARESGYSSSVLTCGFSRVWANLTKASLEELMQSEAPALLARAPVEVWANACLPFAERQKLAEDDDPLKNIGIRMVFSIAKDVKYQNVMGLNVLTIWI